MGTLRMLVAFGALVVALARASPSVGLDTLPQCSVPCFVSGLAVSQCSPLDQDCLCRDIGYRANVTDCVKDSCNVPNQLATKNVTSFGCGVPPNNHDIAIVVLLSTIYPAASIAVVVRVATKLLKLSSWGWDDYTIIIGQVVSAVFVVIGPIQIQMGLGRDSWTLTPYQIATFLKLFFVSEVTYTFTLCVVKVSYLFFFLRVFRASPVRKYILGTIIFTITAGTVFVTVDLVQCLPVDLFWNQWDGEPRRGGCININAMTWSHAVINILLDCWMMALPASQVIRLRLATWKKIGLMVMFGAGFLLTLVSVLRLQSLAQFEMSQENITMAFFFVSVYSPIECQAGVLCACLPACAQLMQRIYAARPCWMKQRSKTTPTGGLKSGSTRAAKTIGSQTVERRYTEDEQELYILGYGDNTCPSTGSAAAADLEGLKMHHSTPRPWEPRKF